MKHLIFVVDSDSEILKLAEHSLAAAGYAVRTSCGEDIATDLTNCHPSLFLMAFMLPRGSGLDFYRQLSQTLQIENVPIIFLLDQPSEQHRLLVLESGADDCIAKPFSPRELVARIHAVLRRSSSRLSPSPELADLVIDIGAMKLSVRGNEIPTTTLEFRLVEYMARHAGQVFTRDFLLDSVWGDTQFITPRSVDACVRRIREKIELDRANPTLLKTIRGVGYRLDAVTAWQSSSNEDCSCAACRTPYSMMNRDLSSSKRRRIAGD